MFLIGTSPLLSLDRSSTTIMIGLLILGFSAPMISIPLLPDMLESIEVATDLNYDDGEVNNLAASLFVTCSGVGEALGPILNSVLKKFYGFERAYEIFGLMFFSFAFIYFLFCGHFTICRFEDPKVHEDSDGMSELEGHN